LGAPEPVRCQSHGGAYKTRGDSHQQPAFESSKSLNFPPVWWLTTLSGAVDRGGFHRQLQGARNAGRCTFGQQGPVV